MEDHGEAETPQFAKGHRLVYAITVYATRTQTNSLCYKDTD